MSPEAQRFSSYYGDEEELQLRLLKRGIVKFNSGSNPRQVSCWRAL
jgi:hypothetical protein